MSECNNQTHGHLIEAHDRLVQCINTLACGGDVSSYLLTVDEWHSVQAVGKRLNAQATRLAAQQPVIDAVLQLSTYSRETVDDGVRRIVQASDEYEEWLLGHHEEEP